MSLHDEAINKQLEEIDALKVIYGDEAVKQTSLQESGCQRLEVSLKEGIKLVVHLTPDYPGRDLPSVEFRGLRHNAEELHRGLQEIHTQCDGEIVLFKWIEFLRERLELEADAQDQDDNASNPEEPQNEERMEVNINDLEVHQGEPITEKKSTFQGFCACISGEQDAIRFLAWLKCHSKIAKATHNIWAFRVWDQQKQAQVNDHDDDGETAAGGKLAELLRIMNVNGVIVVVSRWFGGILLGPARFALINNTARSLLEQAGHGRKAHLEKASGRQKKYSIR